MATRLNIAQAAVDLLGLSGSLMQGNSDDSSRAVRYLERMMLEWQSKGLVTGYVKANDIINPDPNTELGIDDSEVSAAISNLAVKLAPHYGIPASRELMIDAKRSYQDIFSTDLTPYKQSPMQPAGQGYQRCAYSPNYMHVEDETQDTGQAE